MLHYRDKSGLEREAVLELNDGRFALAELKLGSKQIWLVAMFPQNGHCLLRQGKQGAGGRGVRYNYNHGKASKTTLDFDCRSVL